MVKVVFIFANSISVFIARAVVKFGCQKTQTWKGSNTKPKGQLSQQKIFSSQIYSVSQLPGCRTQKSQVNPEQCSKSCQTRLWCTDIICLLRQAFCREGSESFVIFQQQQKKGQRTFYRILTSRSHPFGEVTFSSFSIKSLKWGNYGDSLFTFVSSHCGILLDTMDSEIFISHLNIFLNHS